MTTDLITVGPAAHIKEVIRLFTEKAVSGIPVVDAANKLLGVVTKKDLIDALLPTYLDLMEHVDFIEDFGHMELDIFEEFDNPLFIAADMMNAHPVTVTQDCTLLKAAALMNKNNVEALLVVIGGKLTGVFALTDLCKALFTLTQ